MESRSYIEIDVNSSVLTDYLKDRNIGNVFQDIENLYEEGEMLSVELKQSISKSLISILEKIENDLEDEVIPTIVDLDTIDELCQFIKQNINEIDNEAEGSIVINSVNPEDGYAYAQKLVCKGETCVLSKWPFSNGFTKNYSKIQEYNRMLINGEIKELKGYSYPIWEIVADDKLLDKVMNKIAVSKTVERQIKSTTPKPVSKNASISSVNDEILPKTLKELKAIYKVKTDNDYIYINGIKTSMQEIMIPGEMAGKQVIIGNNAFANDSILQKVVITDNARLIGENTFYGCKKLKDVSIGKGINDIACNAFNQTPWLKKQSDMVIINDLLFLYKGEEKNVVIPEGITIIGKNAFYESEIESISLPESVVRIEENAFYNCSKIKDITIPEQVRFVGNMAFNWCESLENINVQSRDIQFGKWAFSATKWAENTEGWQIINDILIGINMDSFYSSEISRAECLVIPENIRVIATDAMNSDVFDWSEVKEIVLPGKLEIISEDAFKEFTNLEKINFPTSLKVIGGGAFYNCTSLKEVNLPDGLISIGAIAFYNTAIDEIVVPSSVIEMSDTAFPWECRIKR